MKTTTKLWIIGITCGLAGFFTLAFTLGYVIAINPPSSPKYDLIAAMIACCGFAAVGCCLTAVVLKAFHSDRAAEAELRKFAGPFASDRPGADVRRLR